jgi:hypothetical protein
MKKLRCPKCGEFIPNENVKAYINTATRNIFAVKGDCRKRGEVDLTREGWTTDDFKNKDGLK